MDKLFKSIILLTLSDWAALCGIIAFFISIISIAFSARKYIAIRSQEQHQKNFENYHKLLKFISSGCDENYKKTTLESQLAHIFELGNFPEYKEITHRFLNSLKEDWETNETREKNKRLLFAEISNTFKKLKIKNS